MPVNSPLLEQCFDEAVRHAAPSLGRCIDVAVSSLQQEEKDQRDVAARDRCARAWYTLIKHRQTWGPAFAQRLKGALQNGYNEGNTSSMALLSNSELLALVDDSAVNESIESAKVLQNLLPEVEQALAKHPGVRQCAVIGLPDPKWGERVTAVIVPAAGATPTPEEIIAHCRGLIAGYKVPKEVRLVDAFPMTATGKILKRAVREQMTKSG